MDITQIPKGMGVDEAKWMHYLTAMGVNFFNPYEEGWNIPGREGGKSAQFNQFSSIDLTMTNVIAEYINLLTKIEEMIGELSGVSKQRQGSIATNELVGNVERSVIQSSHITEPLFWKHNVIKRNALTALLNTAKFAWRMHDKKKINFVLNGPERVFLKITEDFLYSDHDVFLSDATKEHRDIEKLEQLYQPAMQNGATLLDIASIMTANNMSEIKLKLTDIEQKRSEAIQQQAQVEQALQEQVNQVNQDKNRITEEDSIRKAETSITVALIQADSQGGKEQNTTEKIPEQPSMVELEKLNLEKDKVRKDYELKTRQIRETERHNKITESISNKKKTTTSK
jgi:cell division protein ZapA (FtsZ GTPase activity inhibitor)